MESDQINHPPRLSPGDTQFCDAVIAMAQAHAEREMPENYLSLLRTLTEEATRVITARLSRGEDDPWALARLRAVSTRVIDIVPLDMLDEIEIALLVESARRWPHEINRAVEAAKRVALVFYTDFWPADSPRKIAAATRFGLIANDLPAPVFFASSDQRITFSSYELDGLLNLIQGEAERFSMTDLFGSVLNIGRDNPTTVELAADGGYRHLVVTVIPVETNVGTEYFGFVDDRTRELRLEEMRDDVVTAVSHQLRTPLTVIMGYLDLLTNGDIPPSETQPVLATVNRQGIDLLTLVTNIVDFSKLTAGTAHVKPTRQHLAVAVHSLLAEVEEAARPRIDFPIDVEIIADPDRLQQVLRILLDNARIHGGPDVLLEARQLTTGTEIVISDDGPGVPDEISLDLARPYLSVENTPDGHTLGLGLAIARGVMLAHEGALTVENGERTVVTAWFPNR